MGVRFSRIGSALVAAILCARGLAASAAKSPAPLSQEVQEAQEAFGRRLIAVFQRGDYAAARAAFDSSIRANVTEEIFRGVQAQIKDLSAAAGDSLEQVSSGESVAMRYGPIFFREYRFVNEVAKGRPGVLINVSFPDSTTDHALGLFIKRLAVPETSQRQGQVSTYRGEEKTLEGPQKWQVAGGVVDVDEIALLDFREGHMLSIKVYDDSAATLNMASAKRKAVPIVKEAEARGVLKKAKRENGDLLDRVGVAFLIRDGSGGFRAQVEPSEYR